MALDNAAQVTQTPEFGADIFSVDSIVGIFGGREIADADYPALQADTYIGFSALTATRQVILPAAAGYPKGKALVIADESGVCFPSMGIKIAASGMDTIAGQQTILMGAPYQELTIRSNGKNLWTYN